MCARRKGTHPVHANLTVKFIYTRARGNASPKEIHDSITAGQPPGLVKKGPERVRDTACAPAPGAQSAGSYFPLLSFPGPLSSMHPAFTSRWQSRLYVPPRNDQAAPQRRRQTAPAPVTSSRRRRSSGWSAPVGGGEQAGPRAPVAALWGRGHMPPAAGWRARAGRWGGRWALR